MNTATDTLAVKLPVTGSQPAAMTAQLTTITHTAPGTPDYAFGTVTTTSGAGFSSVDEANSLLAVVANLQIRLLEVEAILEGLNAVDAN
jgi:hypothetical protein